MGLYLTFVGRTYLNKLFLLFGIVGLAGTSAFATPVSVVFVDEGTHIGGGYYLSPYTGTITPSGSPTSTVQLVCDDINHGVSNGDAWTANITAVTATDLSNTLYGVTNVNPAGPTGNTLYEEQAYLAGQIIEDFSTSNPGAIEAIQDAMWVLTASPSNAVPNASSTDVQNWVAAAQNYVASSNSSAFNGWYVLTDANTGDPHQEFMFYSTDPLTQTPEPATLALAGCGLLVVYFGGSRRRRKLSA
jgi:hypothetical protein